MQTAENVWRKPPDGLLAGRPIAISNPASPISAFDTIADRLALGDHILQAARRQSEMCGTTAQTELLASGVVSEPAYFGAVAAVLNLPFLSRLDGEGLVLRDGDCTTLLARRGSLHARYLGEDNIPRIVIAPEEGDLKRLHRLLARAPSLRDRIAIVTPSELRRALLQRGRLHMLHRVRNLLFDALPHCSARVVASGLQGFGLGMLFCALVVGSLWYTSWTWLGIHLAATTFFLACVMLRTLALGSVATPQYRHPDAVDPRIMPVYTVLVALRGEAAIVPELLKALDQLAWPRSKLEIKLICEADDPETIAAIRAHELPPCMEIIEVPPAEPRTKPKALAYALQASRGDLVVLYDAEDRPHPWQLIEAWQHFGKHGEDLACLQAPLHITNGTRSAIAAMFGFEYAALFRGLLPYLSRKALLLPLGGTSNHFRRAALDKIGGWDPFNVTEDADLGVRLARFGYRTETIHFPTYEAGPETMDVWLKQRTRWFKGWMQTWLVHMRAPVRLAGELGLASFVISQILFAGMVASALLHPLLLVTIAYMALDFAGTHNVNVVPTTLFMIDLASVMLGYSAFLLLGRAAAGMGFGPRFWRVVALTPIYWMMLSWAAWRALFQLFHNPFLWEKTPHPHGLGTDPPLHGRS